jgi:hypothetical protein
MLERSHWWLAALVIFLGTVFPVVILSIFGIESDAGLTFFALCILACILAVATYGIWVATQAFARDHEASKRRRS